MLFLSLLAALFEIFPAAFGLSQMLKFENPLVCVHYPYVEFSRQSSRRPPEAQGKAVPTYSGPN
jgi:hypothetical protein